MMNQVNQTYISEKLIKIFKSAKKFFVNFDSAFNNFSSLLVKVIPGLIMETETLSIFPCKAKLLEKWFYLKIQI